MGIVLGFFFLCFFFLPYRSFLNVFFPLSLSLLWVFKVTIVFAEASALISLGSSKDLTVGIGPYSPRAPRTSRTSREDEEDGDPLKTSRTAAEEDSSRSDHSLIISMKTRRCKISCSQKALLIFQGFGKGYGLPPPSRRNNWNWTLSLMWKKASYFLFQANIVFLGY